MTADGRASLLADGNQMPMLGLGVWQVPNGSECVNAVRWALEFGYRHIDTAQAYGNEDSVGQGLRESGVPREEVFITTKFYPRRQDPVAEAEGSLGRLGVDHVDLRHGVALEAYSPLGTGRLPSDATVRAIAARAGRTPAQVVVRAARCASAVQLNPASPAIPIGPDWVILWPVLPLDGGQQTGL